MHKELSEALIESIFKMGKMTTCQHILIIGSVEIERLKPLRKKLVYAHSEPYVVNQLIEQNYHVVTLPAYSGSRHDRLKAAIIGAVSSNLLNKKDNLLCALSQGEGKAIDTIMHLQADQIQEENLSLMVTELEHNLPAQLLEVLVDLALKIGQDGYESHPLGALIIVGDSTAVMEHSHALVLNPFQGYSEPERNLFDRSVRAAILAFAMLDGAFVVREDGVVLAAGRHIRVHQKPPAVPSGLGTRHSVAASISAETNAVAITVSQSSGIVRIFIRGKIALTLAPEGRRIHLMDSRIPKVRQIHSTLKRKKKISEKSGEKNCENIQLKRSPTKKVVRNTSSKKIKLEK